MIGSNKSKEQSKAKDFTYRTEEENATPLQISASSSSNGVEKEAGNDPVREKKSRWRASAEEEEDVG
jgi:hypothetical protein